MRPAQVDKDHSHPFLVRILFVVAGMIILGATVLFALLPSMVPVSQVWEFRLSIVVTVWSCLIFLFFILLPITGD